MLQTMTGSRFSLLHAILAAFLLVGISAAPRSAHAGVAVDTNDVITYEYQQTGANEEEAVRLACIRAVNATIGRLLFSDYGLQGRDLLDPYIQKHWQRFVASYYVLERRFERDGFGCRIRVQTFPEVLQRDLREKKFLYLPRMNPYHYVFFSQTVDAQPAESDTGRKAVTQALLAKGYKAFESGIQVPANSSDVMGDPAVFAAAREAAQRIGAEIIVAVRAQTRKLPESEQLYEKIYNYETVVHEVLIRADDGSQLGQGVDVTMRASDSNEAVAREDSIKNASETATQRTIAQASGLWRSLIQNVCDYSIMLTDVTPAELDLFATHLESALKSGSSVQVRMFFSNVGVLSVSSARDYSVVQRAIQDYKGLNLRVSDQQGKRITVDVYR